MATWNEYKETFSTTTNIFDWARSNDCYSLLTNLPTLGDLNIQNTSGHSPLMLSIYKGNYEFAEVLLEHGADVNDVDSLGNTPLMGASFKGDLDAIKLLLRYNADYSAKNTAGLDAYDWAKNFNRKNILVFFNTYYQEKKTNKFIIYIKFLKLFIDNCFKNKKFKDKTI